MSYHTKIPNLSDEYRTADLGDPRRVARVCRIAEAAARAPEVSLARQAGSEAALEGTYRLLNNDRVRPEALLDAHAGCTVARAAAAGEVLVIHDTTKFRFGGELMRQGLGPVAGANSQGFLSHASLCVGRDGQPLGVLRLHSWARTGPSKGRRSQQAANYDPDRESLRWSEGVHATAEQLAGVTQGIHVMDREGDCIELIADLVEHDYRFVIRLAHDRRLTPGRKADGTAKLYEALSSAPVIVEREVPLSARTHRGKTPRQKKRFPARAMRSARLAIRAQRLAIAAGNGTAAHIPRQLELNFIEVCEVDPPDGEAPVLWRLVTTESIETADDVAAVVDSYCRRWLIEEYFKALKTGCSFEKLQLETGDALMRTLAIFASVAWRLLLIRWMDRHHPDAPAHSVVTPTQLAVLRAVRAKANRPLAAHPTAHEVLWAIAALGAHLKRNGPPGWRVLGRGFDTLLLLEQGWLAAKDLADVPTDL
jgi:hypothetical protein